MCGVSASYISDVENHRSNMSLKSLNKIAKALRVDPSYFLDDKAVTLETLADLKAHTTVTSILDTPLYAGLISFGGQKFQGKHKPMIDMETFEKVQQLRKTRQIKKEKAFAYKSLLGGLIYCGYCGARYARKDNRGQFEYYVCYSRAKTKKYMIKDPKCMNKNWPREELDKKVEAEIFKLTTDENYLQEIIQVKPREEDTNEDEIILKRINEIDKQTSKLIDLYQYGTIPAEELGARIEKLRTEKQSLEDQIDLKEEESVVDMQSVMIVINNLETIWSNATTDERRGLLTSLIDRILIYDERIEIEWSFRSR